MINYKFPEEKVVALYLADLLGDIKAKEVIESGMVNNNVEATHLSKFFWKMVKKSADENHTNLKLPCSGNAQYWTEKLYNSIGGYLERVGYEEEWNREIDKE